jgi:ATP-dependent RNA helicase RhlE
MLFSELSLNKTTILFSALFYFYPANLQSPLFEYNFCQMSFENLNLNPKILAALKNKGYTDPTPIQLQVIPHLLAGKDILGIAQTGTGKTAAFSLPILHNLSKSKISVKSGNVRSLILTPTRELASQIADNIEVYGKELNLRYAVVFGGVSERPQISAIQGGVDIMIATPGRLLDLVNQGYIRFMQLEVFVLDEADRMLDMGFINDIKKIIAKIPQQRQTLLFSATMPLTIASLAHSILKNPVKVEVTPASTTVERIEQKINFVAKSNKLLLLKHILKQDNAKSVLVFCKTKYGIGHIEDFLERNAIKALAIHGNKSQTAREKALAGFRDGKVRVLIATDIAARGIDVPNISHVINYDIPMDPESYVHRIGRTARAGKEGIAISFCDPGEVKLLQAIEKIINFKIPVDENHPLHGVEASSLSKDKNYERSGKNLAQNPDRKNYGRNYANSENKYRKTTARKDERAERDDKKRGGKKLQNQESQNSRKKNKNGIFSFIDFGKKKLDAAFGKTGKTQSDNPSAAKKTKNKNSNSAFSWFKSKKSVSNSASNSGRSKNNPSFSKKR